jgi:GT2 family glycosyltransferase
MKEKKNNSEKTVLTPLLVDYKEKRKKFSFEYKPIYIRGIGNTKYQRVNSKIKDLKEYICFNEIFPFQGVGCFFIEKELYIRTKGYNDDLFFLYHEDGEYGARLINTYNVNIYRTMGSILFHKEHGAVIKNFKKGTKNKEFEIQKNANKLKVVLLHYSSQDLVLSFIPYTLNYLLLLTYQKNLFLLPRILGRIYKERKKIQYYRKQSKFIDFSNKKYYSKSFKDTLNYFFSRFKSLIRR